MAMRTLLLLVGIFLVSCQPDEKKIERVVREGEVLMSVYKLENGKSKVPSYWYIILSYDATQTYYYYNVSSKPVKDFFVVKWKKVTDLPSEILMAQPEEVIEVSLTDLPPEVQVPIDSTLQ